MKCLIYLTVILFSVVSCTSGHNNGDEAIVRQTREYLDIYSGLSPFNYYYSIHELNLPEPVIDSLLSNSDYNSSFDVTKDSIESYVLISYLQDKISANLIDILETPDIMQYDLQAMLKHDDLSIIVSDDKKIYCISFDEKTGGSYRSMVTVMYYTGFDKAQRIKSGPFDNGRYSVFSSDGYDNIYSLAAGKETKYVLIGSVRYCSMCFLSSVALVSPQSNGFEEDFYYNTDSRSYESGVSYNPETQIILAEYETDDLTPDCYCDMDDKPESVFGQEVVPKKCECEFIFNGETFQLK